MKDKTTDDESNVSENEKSKDEKNGETKKKSGNKTQQKCRRGWVELDSDEESVAEKNIFAVTMVTEAKRKRSVSNVNELAEQWIVEHLQAKPMVRLLFTNLYEYYVGDSLAQGQVMEEKDFRQLIKKTYPDGFAFRDDSPLKYELKEMKMADKTKKKARGESKKLMMHDVLDVVLRELGNPKAGVRFHKINLTAASKYPALHLHLRPGMMLGAILKGLQKQQIICTKGIGKCGYYRLATPDGADDDQTISDNTTAVVDDETSMPLKKRKIDSGSGDTDGVGEEEKTSLSRKADEKSAKRKDNEKKSPAPYIGNISHSNPRHITHIFPMAFTFQSEPKVASIRKVRDYIHSYYPQTFKESRFIRVLENGFGFSDWTRVSGKGLSGSVQLTLDTWNPKYDDKMRDQIINAIIACNEPKQSGSMMIRQYIEEFHPRFKVQGGASKGKCDRFRKAWQKAIDCGLIVQLSGIGLAGTFQLGKTFEPSPANLAGENSDGDGYDGESSEDSSDGDDKRQSVSRGRLRRQVPKHYADYDSDVDEKYSPRSHVTSHNRNNQKKSDKQSSARRKAKVTSTAAALKKSRKTGSRQSKGSRKDQPSSDEEGSSLSNGEDGGRVNNKRRKMAPSGATWKKVNSTRTKQSTLMVKLEALSDDQIRSNSSSDDEDDGDVGGLKRRKAKSNSPKKSKTDKSGRKRSSKQSEDGDDSESEVESRRKKRTVSPVKGKGKGSKAAKSRTRQR